MPFQPSEQNVNWVGNKAAYRTLHHRVELLYGKAASHVCVDCGKVANDWSHRHETDPVIPENYDPRCRSCHLKYDRVDDQNGHVGRTGYAKGSQHGNAKLIEDQVKEIRERKDAGETLESLAESFNVCRATIRKIVDRRSWTHI